MRELPTVLGALEAATTWASFLALAFGMRDALRTLRHNSYVHLSRYFWVYVAVPVVALTTLVLPLSLAVALIGYGFGLSVASIGGASAGFVLVVILAIDARTWLEGLRDGMQQARVAVPARRRAVLLGAGVLTLTAMVSGVGIAIGVARINPSAVRVLGGAAFVLNLALLPPLVAFVLRDFRFARRVGPRATHVQSARNEPATTARGARRPVVLISIDTLRADRLRSYGSQRDLTPQLDRLAASGVVCGTAIAPSSWTLPSVASFLTGLNPSRHGAGPALNGFDLMARAPLRAGASTLAQEMKAAGYATHAIVSNPYLAVQYRLDAGFDTYENVSIESEALVAIRPTLSGRVLTPLLRSWIGDSGAVVTQRALRFLAKRHATPQPQDAAPCFLWLHYIDPHAPYGCSGNKSFRGDTLLSDLEQHQTGLGDRFEAIARLRAGEIRLSQTEKEQLIALYDAGVAEVDRQIGVVLDHVKALRLSGEGEGGGAPYRSDSRSTSTTHDPLIVVVADHGEEFWDHGGVEHGHTFYDELVRVPLLLAGGGLPQGRRLTELVRLVDLPPTILDLLGLPIPAGLDGRSFARALVDPQDSSLGSARTAVCESLLFAEERVAIRTDRYKYVKWANGKEELYDLGDDPSELRDLAATSDVTWARRAVDELLSTRPDMGDSPRPEGCDADAAAIHARLEALGYV